MNSIQIVREAEALYPAELGQQRDGERVAFLVDLVREYMPPGGRVMDVGGGIGMFSPALALAGFDTTLVDDFGDPINHAYPISELGVHDKLGVNIVDTDASSDDFDPRGDTPFDVVTCIESIEHWHRSPKAALHKMVGALKAGGALILGLPNAFDLKKRIATPLGLGGWSTMESWYEEPVFRSHVREASADDLRYMARDLGLENVRLLGRNWSALASRRRAVRLVSRMMEPALRLKPSLCSDLFLIGTRRRD